MKITIFLFLAALAFGCSLELPKHDSSTRPIRNIIEEVTGVQDYNDEDFTHIYSWKACLLLSFFDNIVVPDFNATLVNTTLGELDIMLEDAHLRGIHKLNGIEDKERDKDAPWPTVHSTLTFDHVELRARVTVNQKLTYRVKIRWSNVKVRSAFLELYGSVYFPVLNNLGDIRFVAIPNIDHFSIKGADSQFGKLPLVHETIASSIKDYLQQTYLHHGIREAFSRITADKMETAITKGLLLGSVTAAAGGQRQLRRSHHINDVCDEWCYEQEIYPIQPTLAVATIVNMGRWLIPDYDFNLGAHYSVDFEQRVGLVITRGTMNITGGEIKGIDYFRRVDCIGMDCWEEEADWNGTQGEVDFKLGFDQFYLTYDIDVKYLGFTYHGKVEVSLSGLRGELKYISKGYCPSLLVCSYRYPEVTGFTIDKGTMMVDVEGLPFTLSFLHAKIIQFAEEKRDEMLSPFAFYNSMSKSPVYGGVLGAVTKVMGLGQKSVK